MRKKSKYICCSVCGQVGASLDKKGEQYVCHDTALCNARQMLKHIRWTICSVAYCATKATWMCDCGMALCNLHAATRPHGSHVMTPITEDEEESP